MNCFAQRQRPAEQAYARYSSLRSSIVILSLGLKQCPLVARTLPRDRRERRLKLGHGGCSKRKFGPIGSGGPVLRLGGHVGGLDANHVDILAVGLKAKNHG